MFGTDMRLNYDWKVTPVVEKTLQSSIMEHSCQNISCSPPPRSIDFSTREISEGCRDWRSFYLSKYLKGYIVTCELGRLIRFSNLHTMFGIRIKNIRDSCLF